MLTLLLEYYSLVRQMMVIIVEIINMQLKQLLTELVQNITNYQAEQKDMGSAAVLITILVAIIIWASFITFITPNI